MHRHFNAARRRPLGLLAVAGPSHSPWLPEVPTIAETGLKDYAVDPWFGVSGPANLPPAVVQALNKAFTTARAMPEVKDKLQAAGFNPRGSSADALTQLTQTEYQRLGDVARKAGMSVD